MLTEAAERNGNCEDTEESVQDNAMPFATLKTTVIVDDRHAYAAFLVVVVVVTAVAVALTVDIAIIAISARLDQTHWIIWVLNHNRRLSTGIG